MIYFPILEKMYTPVDEIIRFLFLRTEDNPRKLTLATQALTSSKNDLPHC